MRYTRATAIVGDILKIHAHDVGLGDMALVDLPSRGTDSGCKPMSSSLCDPAIEETVLKALGQRCGETERRRA